MATLKIILRRKLIHEGPLFLDTEKLSQTGVRGINPVKNLRNDKWLHEKLACGTGKQPF
jgi:hypothetical protein